MSHLTGPQPLGQQAPAADSVSRVARLTLKELRETLRDRRTIVTLVLMPLLVYPLLSLGFKQFLFANLTKSDTAVWRIAAETDEDGKRLAALLAQGEFLLQQAESATRNPSESRPKSPADPAGAQAGTSLDSAPGVYTYSGGDLETAILHSEIDLGIRMRPQQRVVAGGAGGAADFELIYLADSTNGLMLARYVSDRLRALNERYVVDRLKDLGDSGDLPARWQSRPLAGRETPDFPFATLIPMILILMTITGAVYPAIDLTAGERERGTLEALMAAPVPRLGLLFAKYLAVLTVAMLTALVNIVGMTITLLSTGLGSVLFGEQGLSASSVVIVFGLLVLFAAFFSAVLLCVTSFARSFKEAQAYLIPLMLVALAPGFLTMMPGIELNGWMSVAPLANIALLARDTLAGHAHPLWGFVAVLTTALYGTAALGLAAHIFGSDSILYGSQGSWSDLFRRPKQPLARPTLAGAMSCLALIVPLYVVLSGSLLQLAGERMAVQLIAGAAMLVVLFILLPLAAAAFQGVSIQSGFQLRTPAFIAVLGAAILGCALAPLALELILLSQQFGLGTLDDSELAAKTPAVQRLVSAWQKLPPMLVIAAIALVPAIAEELFFRGYFLNSQRGRLPAWLAILFTALVFGLFHASVGGIVAVERIFSSMALGIVLGWVCWTTKSVIPGMLAHALSNTFVIGLAYWGDVLKGLHWDLENQRHVPAEWLAGAALLGAMGATLIYLGRTAAIREPLPASPLAAETPPP